MLQTLQRCRTPSGTAYVDRGQACETVVLLHGVGMRAEAWAPQIERLSQDFRVVAVDLPGHGLSSPLGKPPLLQNFVGWFDALLDELAVGSINVAGHSMGALISAGIVATAPERVKRVALLNGVHRRDAAARSAVEARAHEILTGRFDREAPLARWFSDAERETAAYALARDLLQMVDADGYATAYRAFATGDALYSGCWPDVGCPALFLTGEDDPNSTPDMARDMAAAAPHGRAVIISGHRHMVNLTAPQEVNEALAQWLTSTGER